MSADTDTDEGMERAFQADQRILHRGGGQHTCPTCGTPNALSNEEKRRGYHCGRCTLATEEGW